MNAHSLIRASALGLAFLGLLAVPAGAATDEVADGLRIRQVDTTDFPEVRITVQATGIEPGADDFEVEENELTLDDIDVVPLARTGTEVGVVLVVDTSAVNASAGDALESVKAAARSFVEDRRPNQDIALLAYNSAQRVEVGLTSDEATLLRAIDGLSAEGASDAADALTRAPALLASRPDLQPNVVVVTAGGPDASFSSLAETESALLSMGGPVFALSYGDEDERLRDLARSTGGSWAGVSADGDVLPGALATILSSIGSQVEVSYTSLSNEEVLELRLSAAGEEATAATGTGTVSSGSTGPQVVAPEPPLLPGDAGKWLAVVLAFAAVAAVGGWIASVMLREESNLTRVLRPYEDGAEPTASAESGSGGEAFLGNTRIGETRLMQRAVEMTEGFASRRGLLTRVEAGLERADLPLRAGEALFTYGAAVVLGAAVAMAVLPSIVFGAVAALLLALLPPAVVSFLGARRRRAFLGQLPDTLQLLAGSLRAGYSLMQGVDAVSEEVEDPMGQELRRVLAESRLGRPLEQSLDEAAERMASPDFAWAVMAIRIQREVGGNLSELLQTVAETMISRERMRREVRALTAEGRMSAIVLGLLPVGIGLAVWMLNRSYMQVLVSEPIGQYMLGGSVVLALFGFWWMKKTIEIEV